MFTTKLIFGIVALTALIGVSLYMMHHLEEQGRVLQANDDAPVIKGQTDRADRAESANRTFVEDLARIQLAVDERNAIIERMTAASKAAAAEASRVIAAANAKARAAKTLADKLTADAQVPHQNPKEACDAADTALRSVIDRLRD